MPLKISLPGVSPKWLILGAATFAAGLVAYHTVFNVNKRDAILHQSYERPVRGQVILAGDIVAVSRTRQRRVVEPLCTFATETARVDFSWRYVNGLAEDLPGFLSLIDKVWPGAAEGEAGGPLREVRLSGHAVSLPRSAQPPIPEDCGRAIAASLDDGQKVCVVAQAVLETSFVPADPSDPSKGFELSKETVGLTFRETAITRPDAAAETCAGLSGYGPAVLLRHKLDVIREVALPRPTDLDAANPDRV